MRATFWPRLLLMAFCWGAVPRAATASEPILPPAAKAALHAGSAEAGQKVLRVSTVQELRTALEALQAGTTILIAPGSYSRGVFLKNVHGTRESPIVLAATDPAHPPEFSGFGEGAKLSSCSYVKLSGMTFRGFTNNGVNLDDGGDAQRPSHHVILERIAILDTGPKGNHDALKISGVDHFIVRDCRFEGWGGSGIDLVGCHRGIIEGCRFIGREGYRTKSAVQIKGGSRSILVQMSFFQDAGERIVSIGGATGSAYFRPADATCEAQDVTVAGNRFVGGEAQIVWVTSQNSRVHHNVFYFPGRWLGRIQQETKDPRFLPCQGGQFDDNLVVTDARVRVFINVGSGTNPSSFTFRRNAWYREGDGAKPELPTTEAEGILDVDPALKDAGTATMRIGSVDPRLQSIGPGAYEAWSSGEDFADVRVPLIEPAPPPPRTPRLLGSYCAYGVLAVLAVVAVVIAMLRRRGWGMISTGVRGFLFRKPRYAILAAGVLVYAYAAAVVGVWALLRLAGDRWWFASLLLLGPRWVYAIPLVVFVPPAIAWRRRWLWPLGLSAVVILWPIMGLNVPLAGWGDPGQPTLRVMTFNIGRWSVKEPDFAALLAATSPDLVAIQECPSRQWEIPDGWHVQRAGELIVASRYPILRSEVSHCRWPPREKPDVNGLYCLVEAPGGPVGFASIHLDTPRRALQLILDPEKILDLSEVRPAEARLECRRRESRDLAEWIRGFPEPKIIAGDFNMPVDSGLYRDFWSDYANAFSQTGFGYGHTKHTKISRLTYGARIDHVLSTAGLRPVRCWVGPDVGSDHQPLFADLASE